MNTYSAAASYNKVRNGAGVESASPHKLIEMLFDGALERIAQAKGAIEYKEIELKGSRINSAISIIGGLRESLNHEEGGDISANLDSLYVYTQNILSKAHFNNDLQLLDEAATILADLRSAWVQIAD